MTTGVWRIGADVDETVRAIVAERTLIVVEFLCSHGFSSGRK